MASLAATLANLEEYHSGYTESYLFSEVMARSGREAKNNVNSFIPLQTSIVAKSK